MGRPNPPFEAPLLATPFEEMDDHYDVAVVGSGYGGGVAAARLSRAGYRVCVLERGQELRPGDYPSSLRDAVRAFQVNVRGRNIGRDTALFDFHMGDDFSALVGCGLGGTSLINANVCLETESWVFERDEWPRELRRDRNGSLAEGIERAMRMLDAKPFPGVPFDLQKLRALELESDALKGQGARFSQPPLAVNFESKRNRVGIEQGACRNCGDCVSGCNYGAKNTVLMNYLPYAKRCGAEIFTEIAVERVERREDGRWLARFTRVGTKEDSFDAALRFVSADKVVLAAGTLGSTKILLRSHDEERLPLSDTLGARLTGNADTFAFAYDAERPVNAIGLGEEPIEEHPPVGPCITGLIDLRSEKGEDGFVIEDGSPPGAIAKALPLFLAFMSVLGVPGRRILNGAWWRVLRSLPWNAYDGAVHRTQTHLVMGHDAGRGKLELDDRGRWDLSYEEYGNEDIFKKIDVTLKRAADAIRGAHISNPLWDKFWVNPLRRFRFWLAARYRPKKRGDRDLVTVHPLGGCGMGEDATQGVVNHLHQVFRGSSGTDVHEGLYVMDGSVMPRSLGVNPLLTISGLAERACAYLLAEEGRELVDDEFTDAFPEERWRPKRLGLRFTEKMTGHVDPEAHTVADASYASEKRAYRWAEKRGARKGQDLTVVLDMEIDDVDRLIEDPLHAVRVSGVVQGAGLPGGPGMVVKGSYAHILTWSKERVNHRTMAYWLNVVTADGRKWVVEGEKWVRDHHSPIPLWKETTELFVRVHEVEEGRSFEDVADRSGLEEIALGVIHIKILGFLKQIFITQRPVNARGFLDGWGARLRFNRFFLAQVLPHSGPAFYRAQQVERAKSRVPRRSDVLPDRQEYPFETEDGVELMLSRYRGGDEGSVMLVHGLGVSSRIFSIDTLEENLLEHLCAKGYDVWLLDYRASTDRPGCFTQFDADTVAKYDHPKAIETILDETEEESLRVLAHCYGATTFLMSMLGGHVEPAKIRSLVLSQVATHMTTGSETRFKAGVRAGNQLWWLLRWRLPNAYTDDAATPAHRRANYLLRFWRVPASERCRSDVCHRIRFLYSRLYEHEQLDPATHDALHEMFGVANMTAMRQLAEMSRQGKLVDANGGDVYIDKMAENLPFPIRFIHGSRNACYHPVSTWTTWKLLEELREKNPEKNPGPYDWHEIPDLGHLDCIFGRRAAERAYPKISAHFAAH